MDDPNKPTSRQQHTVRSTKPLFFGSGPNADVKFIGGADNIEPVHCEIGIDQGRLYLRNLSTKAGTWLKLVPKQKYPLVSNDIIKTYPFTFVFKEILGIESL